MPRSNWKCLIFIVYYVINGIVKDHHKKEERKLLVMHSWQTTIQKVLSCLPCIFSHWVLHLFYLKINSKYSLEQYISLKLLCCLIVSKHFFWIQRAKITCFHIKTTSEMQTEWYLNFSSLLLHNISGLREEKHKRKEEEGVRKAKACGVQFIHSPPIQRTEQHWENFWGIWEGATKSNF